MVEGALAATKNVALSVQDATFGVAQGMIAGARDVGADLGTTAKQAVRGSIQGAREIKSDALEAVQSTARGLIKGTADVGGDLLVDEEIGALIHRAGVTPDPRRSPRVARRSSSSRAAARARDGPRRCTPCSP